MKVLNVNVVKSIGTPVKVADCMVDNGYVKSGHGSLPDIDSDFSADRRDEVKAYLEKRYNKNGLQRVFSAGTFTTEKIKSVIKDVARVYRVPLATTNYLTAILEDDMSWTDLMRMASQDKRLKDFICKYPEVFEDILPIMGQARSAGIHASAVIVTPEYVKGERVDCYDLLPVRKMGDLLVSEISGNDIDAIGILKNDVLGIRELTRMSDMLQLIKDEYGVTYTILDIASKYLNDPKVFEVIKAGNTQGIFQMSGDGITKFIKRMAPDNINDIIASVALFRPGTLDSGAAENYVMAKRGEFDPEYLWGTYDILKETFAQMCYQEQISQVAQKVGMLSLSDGVNLVKALSKKKLEKVRKFQDKFFEGCKKNGCPKDAAEHIWKNVEDAAKYAFNKCISGDEVIRRGSVGSLTIAQIYKAKNDLSWAKENGKIHTRNRLQRVGYGTGWSLNENNVLVKNGIKDIRYMGIRAIYRITLENGMTIDVTNNHRHPTTNGTKRTDELVIGVDEMYYNAGYVKQGEKGLAVGASKVMSVEYLKHGEVYDVEMCDPYHTFVTGNGVVTHNSHATAYGLTAYVGAWLKTYYPTAFYTVILRDQDDDKMAILLNEIEAEGGTKIVQPDINISDVNFTADFKNNKIYWSLTRIKQLGPKAVQYIVQERKLYGKFDNMEDFIKRIFKSKFKSFEDDGEPSARERCPVTARVVRQLIYAGAFDQCDNVGSITERYGLMVKAAELLGFEISEKDIPEELKGKHYFWSQKQIGVSGTGAIDYRRIYDNMDKKVSSQRYKFIDFEDLSDMFYDVKKGVVCCSIADVVDKSYKDKQTGETKHFGKITLHQNTQTNILTIWDDWAVLKDQFKTAVGKIMIAVVGVKWSDYDEKNVLQINKNTYLTIL